MSSARGAVTTARDAVSHTLSAAVERTRGAVQGGMERTRAAVGGGIGAVLESRVGRLVSSGVDTALSTSESLVDQYLPGTEDEPGEPGPRPWGSGSEVNPLFSSEPKVQSVEGFEAAAPSYLVRLEGLSARLRKRTYSRAVSKLQEARRRSRELMQSPADLVSDLRTSKTSKRSL